MWRRFLHSSYSALNVQKSPLAVLRGKTGYSFTNCKKALELHQNDLHKAEEWLHQQAKADGWGKVNLQQNRVTQQGLIGISTSRNLIAMVEVNCETDFVARNEKFQTIVASVTESALSHYNQHHSLENGLSKTEISKDELDTMTCNQNSVGSLADLIASGVTLTGEKLSIRRGTCYHFNEKTMLMRAYCHPPALVGKSMLGKYGAFVLYRQNDPLPPDVDISVEEIGKHLCLQIIGRNPKQVGNRIQIIKEEIDRAIELEKKEAQQEKQESSPSSQQDQLQMEMENPVESDKEESSKDSQFTPAELEKRNKVLLLQEYMHDSNYYVWEYLEENGLEVLDFMRFHCGEALD